MYNFEITEIQPSKSTNCFYCKASLPAKSQEHIFNSCWGGSHKTSKLICDQCNSAFSDIDSALSLYIKSIMNAAMFKGERHKEIPKIELEGDYFFEAGGKLKLKKPRVEKRSQPNGTETILYSFNSKSEASRYYNDLGLAKEEIRQLISEAKPEKEDPGLQLAGVTIEPKKQYRSAAHTILKCLRYHLPDKVSHSLTNSVRDFARYDKENYERFAVLVQQKRSFAEELARIWQPGIYCNSVEIYFCSSLNKIIGVVTLLGFTQRSVILAEEYSGEDAILAVVEDTNQSKKPPKAILVKIPKNYPIELLITISPYKPSKEYFDNEGKMMGKFLYPTTVLIHQLDKNIEAISKKRTLLNLQNIYEYEESFLEFFLGLAKVVGVSLSKEKINKKVSSYGFAELKRNYLGKNIEDIEVQKIISRVFEQILEEIKQEDKELIKK
ncbi:MAG: HNH endonuclease [Oscillatoria sp. PMC 1051.18]|nr:HNH endonuclease [Oscillatoria sp. PMC 1050.18]MEC5030679.1 HNH endonuclease [Oscillatoria sp. PMC 1051.18]